MKSTIATILGTAALGLLKKQVGSSVRLTKKMEYEYMMYFILIQDGYNWQTDILEMEKMKEKLWDMQLLEEEPREFVNELYSTLFNPFTIYTPCAKYKAQFRKRSIVPQRNETMEKIAYIANSLEALPDVWFHKENYDPIDPESFHDEFWLIRQYVVNNVLNKLSSLMNNRFPDLNCKSKWMLLDESFVATDIYSQFMNSDYDDLRLFGEEVLLEGDDYSEQSYSSWTVLREEKIYNADTGKRYEPPKRLKPKLRKR